MHDYGNFWVSVLSTTPLSYVMTLATTKCAGIFPWSFVFVEDFVYTEVTQLVISLLYEVENLQLIFHL